MSLTKFTYTDAPKAEIVRYVLESEKFPASGIEVLRAAVTNHRFGVLHSSTPTNIRNTELQGFAAAFLQKRAKVSTKDNGTV